MDKKAESEFLVIFQGSPWEAALVDSMLKDAEIMTTVYGGLRDPYAPLYNIGGGDGTRIMILSEDYEKAKEIVDQYYQNISPDSQS